MIFVLYIVKSIGIFIDRKFFIRVQYPENHCGVDI